MTVGIYHVQIFDERAAQLDSLVAVSFSPLELPIQPKSQLPALMLGRFGADTLWFQRAQISLVQILRYDSEMFERPLLQTFLSAVVLLFQRRHRRFVPGRHLGICLDPLDVWTAEVCTSGM